MDDIRTVEREPLTVEAQLAHISDLLDRLDGQARELGQLQTRIATLERHLDSEREARRAITEEMVLQQQRAKAAGARVTELEAALEENRRVAAELEKQQSTSRRLEDQLNLAWAELRPLRALVSAPWWRRLLKRPARASRRDRKAAKATAKATAARNAAPTAGSES